MARQAGDPDGQLAAMLKQVGAAVEHRTLPVGHELSQADVTLARTWLEKNEALVITD